MLLRSFVNSICSDLQMDDLEFRYKMIRELIPSAEEAIMSISGTGTGFRYDAMQRFNDGTKTAFLLPLNVNIIEKVSVGLNDKYPLSNQMAINSSSYDIVNKRHEMRNNYPMFVSNVHNVNIVYPRSDAKNGLRYTIEALDYTLYMDEGRRLSKPITDYFYEAGTIFDNQNVYLKTNPMKGYSVIRIRTTPSTFIKENDTLELQTDFGNIIIDIKNENEYLYLAEDGSTYKFFTDTFGLDTLVSRTPYKTFANVLFLQGDFDEAANIDVAYKGKPFSFFHFEDDDQMLDSLYDYIRLYCLKEGALYFKMREDYKTYNNDYNQKISILIRETNMRKNKGRELRFRASETIGDRPQGR